MEKKFSFSQAMAALQARFRERHDKENATHKGLQIRLNDLTAQVSALDTLTTTGDPGTTARAAGRLKELATEAETWLGKKTAETEASFTAALRDHTGLRPGQYAVEIRARLSGMKQGERVKAIQDAITRKDGSTLAAILDAPSILTGISPDDLGKYKEQFFKATAPDLVKARDLTRDLSEHVSAAVKTSLSAAREYADPERVRDAQMQDAARRVAEDRLGGGNGAG